MCNEVETTEELPKHNALLRPNHVSFKIWKTFAIFVQLFLSLSIDEWTHTIISYLKFSIDEEIYLIITFCSKWLFTTKP